MMPAWNTMPNPPATTMAALSEVMKMVNEVAAVPRQFVGSFGIHADHLRARLRPS